MPAIPLSGARRSPPRPGVSWMHSFGADGLIVESKGHYDEAEYERQMSDDSGDS